MKVLISFFLTLLSIQAYGYGKTEGVLGNFLVAPKVTALGAPVPFRFGIEAKWDGLIGLGLDYGFMHRLTFNNTSVKLNGWNAIAKVYPWRGAFNVGFGIGKQNFNGSQTDTIALVPTTATLDYNTTYVRPQIGWNFTWDSGFFLGLELGAQIPISRTSTVSTDNVAASATPEYQNLQARVTDEADKFGNRVLPNFALLQLGWFL